MFEVTKDLREKTRGGSVWLVCVFLHCTTGKLTCACNFSDGAGVRNAEIELRTVETNIYGGDRVRS